MLAVASLSDFSASVGMLSGPTSFPLFICLMSILIPLIVVGLLSLGIYLYAVLIHGKFTGTGLFKSSSKCSTHLLLVSVVGLHSLSLTGFSGLQYFPASFFVAS
ncbi:unnamed protein product [Schistosoma margrebowiei]|uniref:Uncharacterized protein n=1 Tax=Schistosoma margrebowiei TaxID=48269 RepID=A0AA85AA95_9TREM|nr:unnamed protein product [Schistosoma margrebowiei]